MNKIAEYLRRFFSRVESTPVLPPAPEELVDGQAFAIKHYPLPRPVNVMPSDTLNASVHEGHETILSVSEPIDRTMRIDTISVIRFNDALGYKHAVGALFGERKEGDASYRPSEKGK